MKYFIIIIFLLSLLISRTSVYPHTDILDDTRACLERPDLEYSILSPSGHFKIHYNDYYDGIHEFSEDVGIAADFSRYVIVDMMNFDNDKDKVDFCNLKNPSIDSINYFVDEISLKMKICDEFYRNEKYYLNS